MSPQVAVFCADVGSVAKNRFGWCATGKASGMVRGTSMPELAVAVGEELERGAPVALGFECPLFVPISKEPAGLTLARLGDGNRPWSAGAGCGALATGLTQVVWILREIRRLAGTRHDVLLDWAEFVSRGSGLFVWEAFVTGEAKRGGHIADAEAALDAFAIATQQPRLVSAVTCREEAYSLIGAALLRTGWSTDLAVLQRPCVVIRA